jgi:hypothetical protein
MNCLTFSGVIFNRKKRRIDFCLSDWRESREDRFALSAACQQQQQQRNNAKQASADNPG